VLRRAGEAVGRFERLAAQLLIEENGRSWVYEKQPGRAYPRLSQQRRWRGDLALITTPDLAVQGYPWLEFRDVYRLDGRALPDRQGRLERLFLARGEWTVETAAAITKENARFNIGPIWRNLNTPAIGLLMLHPANQHRFGFELTGEETLQRIRTLRVAFSERDSPSLIRGQNGGDCPLSGMLWLHPATGEVLQSVSSCGNRPMWWTETTVSYKPSDRFGVALPTRLVERAAVEGGRLWSESEMRYSRYRRFETRARVIAPK
jgi:hypothetical protein